jgi:hypothetical protein
MVGVGKKSTIPQCVDTELMIDVGNLVAKI